MDSLTSLSQRQPLLIAATLSAVANDKRLVTGSGSVSNVPLVSATKHRHTSSGVNAVMCILNHDSAFLRNDLVDRAALRAKYREGLRAVLFLHVFSMARGCDKFKVIRL